VIRILLYEVEVLKYSTFQYYNYYFNTLEKALKNYNKLISKEHIKVSLNEINDTNIVNLKYKIMKGGQIIEKN
jgi:hypothetical protein